MFQSVQTWPKIKGGCAGDRYGGLSISGMIPERARGVEMESIRQKVNISARTSGGNKNIGEGPIDLFTIGLRTWTVWRVLSKLHRSDLSEISVCFACVSASRFGMEGMWKMEVVFRMEPWNWEYI